MSYTPNHLAAGRRYIATAAMDMDEYTPAGRHIVLRRFRRNHVSISFRRRRRPYQIVSLRSHRTSTAQLGSAGRLLSRGAGRVV